jgi:hypothetical protein
LTVFLASLNYLGKSSYSITLVTSTVTIGGIAFIACFVYDFTTLKTQIFPFHLFAMFSEFTLYLIIFVISVMIWQAVATLAPQATLCMYTNKPVQIGITQLPSKERKYFYEPQIYRKKPFSGHLSLQK